MRRFKAIAHKTLWLKEIIASHRPRVPYFLEILTAERNPITKRWTMVMLKTFSNDARRLSSDAKPKKVAALTSTNILGSHLWRRFFSENHLSIWSKWWSKLNEARPHFMNKCWSKKQLGRLKRRIVWWKNGLSRREERLVMKGRKRFLRKCRRKKMNLKQTRSSAPGRCSDTVRSFHRSGYRTLRRFATCSCLWQLSRMEVTCTFCTPPWSSVAP